MPIAGAPGRQALGVDLAVFHPGLTGGVHLDHQVEQAKRSAGVGPHGVEGAAIDQRPFNLEVEAGMLDRIQLKLAVGEPELRQRLHPLHDWARDRCGQRPDPLTRRRVEREQGEAIVLHGAQDVVARADADRKAPTRRL